jgi:hypothetical protein
MRIFRELKVLMSEFLNVLPHCVPSRVTLSVVKRDPLLCVVVQDYDAKGRDEFAQLCAYTLCGVTLSLASRKLYNSIRVCHVVLETESNS